MTGEEALGILGLTEADAAAVRGAYLRLIRLHKPDTDPEGFRRVREAYELLTRPIVVSLGPGGRRPNRGTLPILWPPPSADASEGVRRPRAARSTLAEGLRKIEIAVAQSSASEVEALIRQLPDASLDEASPEQSLLRLHAAIGALLVAGYRSAASQLLSHFESWLAVHGPTGKHPIGFRTSWAVRVELVHLHPDFPTRWVRALAEASKTGNFDVALEEISRRSLATFPERLEARNHFPRSGFLHQLLAPRFGMSAGPLRRMRLRSRPLGGPAAFIVTLLLIQAVIHLDWPPGASPGTPTNPQNSSYLAEQGLNSSFGAAQTELFRYCGSAPQTGECIRAVTTLDELAWGQCSRASVDLGFLPSTRWAALHAASLQRCALMTTREGGPTPKLAYRSENELAAERLCVLAEQGHQGWWCELGQMMVDDLKAGQCPAARAVLVSFRKRLEGAPPTSPFDRALATDLAQAERAMRRHCGDDP